MLKRDTVRLKLLNRQLTRKVLLSWNSAKHHSQQHEFVNINIICCFHSCLITQNFLQGQALCEGFWLQKVLYNDWMKVS